jgi:hypothetical protein
LGLIFALSILAITQLVCTADEQVPDPLYAVDPALMCANDPSIVPRKCGNPISVETSVLMSKAIHCEPPKFPPLAREARVEGYVVVGVLVNRDGRVGCVKAISGHPLLLGPTMNTAAKWTFKPYNRHGAPMSFFGRLSFHYSTSISADHPRTCTEARC